MRPLVIVQQGKAAYLSGMGPALTRILTLLALLLMPLGMASAPAAAAIPVAGSAGDGHCDDHRKPEGAPAKAEMHCTACAALPALDAPRETVALLPDAPMVISLASSVAGFEPEIATPPPKFA